MVSEVERLKADLAQRDRVIAAVEAQVRQWQHKPTGNAWDAIDPRRTTLDHVSRVIDALLYPHEPSHERPGECACGESWPCDQAACICEPCSGRGIDGHGMEHCAECCFGTGFVVDIDCPLHGADAPRAHFTIHPDGTIEQNVQIDPPQQEEETQ